MRPAHRCVRRCCGWTSAFAEAETISATGDPVLRYVSGRVSPEWMLPKALWLKRHEPEIFEHAARIVECTDWMMHELTGEWTLSLNHVAVKWNYARPDGGWPRGLMATVGLDDLIGKWPETIVPLGRGDGRLSARAAADLGLKAGTPVAQGGIDAYLGMLGMGATGDGDVAVIVGSSTCHLAQSKTGVFGSGAAGCYPDATVEGLYTVEAGQTATGSILDWYRRHFAGTQQGEADRRGVNVYTVLDELAAGVAAGAEGLVVRDDWQGNRSPFKNPAARGAITGLSLAHGPGHLFRALYEATACGTRHILEDAAAHGLRVDRVFVGGGGAKSPVWLQIHADVLKKPIFLTRETESCASARRMAASLAAGFYPDFDAAARAMVHLERTVAPNPANAPIYDELFAQLYRAVSCPQSADQNGSQLRRDRLTIGLFTVLLRFRVAGVGTPTPEHGELGSQYRPQPPFILRVGYGPRHPIQAPWNRAKTSELSKIIEQIIGFACS